MQDGVEGKDVKFTEVEQTLSGMGRLEKLLLGIDEDVSLRWYNIVVPVPSARHVIVTWSKCHLVSLCVYICK